MKFMKTGFISRLFFILLAISLFEYALFHLAYLFVYESFGTVIYYIGTYFSEAWGIIMPALTGLVALFSFSEGGIKGCITSVLILSSSRISFLIFYYYMHFISIGFDSLESISFSLLTSIGLIVLTFIESGIVFIAGYLVIRRGAVARGVSVKDHILPTLRENDPMDIGVGATLTTAVMSLTVFVFRLIYTIYTTITFFIEYGTSFSEKEVFSISIDYLFLLIMLVVTHLVLSVAKGIIHKRRVYVED